MAIGGKFQLNDDCPKTKRVRQIRILALNLENADYIEFQTNVTNGLAYILVDSQADVCILKKDSLNGEYKLDTSDVIDVTGVVKDPIRALGSTVVKIFIENLEFRHKFYIMPSSFNIPSDGIIGKDFNKEYNCVIDYGRESFTIRTKLRDVEIPIHMYSKDTLVIPPRCEFARTFEISSKLPTLIKAQEFKDGVMCSNSIAQNGRAFVRIINATDSVQKIKMPKFEQESLSNYKIYKIGKIVNSEDRTRKLLNILRKAYPNDNKMHAHLDKICTEYADVFSLDEDPLTVNNFYEQTLKVKDNIPVFTKNYRTPYTQKLEISNQTRILRENDLIEPSASSYNSAVILVPKKGKSGEKKWRMCIDYRVVNKKLIPDRFPLPRIDEIIDRLGKSRYFSIIDLKSGFHQVPLHPDFRDITTFSTDEGSFRW